MAQSKTQYIYLKDALEAMRTSDSEGKAVPFSISYRTLNTYNKTGGKLVFHAKAWLVMHEPSTTKDSVQSLKYKRKSSIRRNPNHFTNKTRNIRLPNGDIRKIKINYIITFNGKEVRL